MRRGVCRSLGLIRAGATAGAAQPALSGVRMVLIACSLQVPASGGKAA